MKIHHAAILAVTAVIGLTAPSHAADQWTGFYVGGVAGGMFGHADYNFTDSNVGKSNSGFTGGGEAGWAMTAGPVNLGVEADFSGSTTGEKNACPNVSYACNTGQPWYGTVRGRAGLPLGSRWLPFVTAGFAYGGLHRDSSNSVVSLSQDKVSTGWTAGGGMEAMILPHLSVKAEYLHLELDHQTFAGNNNGFSTVTINGREEIIRLGANFHF